MFERLIQTEACPPARGVFVRHGQKELAVFHLQNPDRFIVSNNACPHASGNLSAGALHGGAVTCPVHKWKFDLDTGHCVGTDDVFLRRYPCKIDGDWLMVDVSRSLPLPRPTKYDF